jgi:thioredoxin-related protein
MENIAKKIEVFANLAIIAAALGLVGLIGYRYFGAEAVKSQEFKIGENISLANTNWAEKEQTLVLVLQKTCHFCQESMPFYKKLTEIAKTRGKTKVVAVFPDPLDDSTQYLNRQSVIVDEIKQSGLTDIKVRGTPTILLVDKDGKIQNSWIGKLPPEKEFEVLDRL